MNSIGIYDYDERDFLGKGGFGRVYLGENVNTGRKVAVKVIYNYWLNKYQRTEIDNLTGLNCRNIVRLLDYQTNYGHVFVIMELCDGDMESRIKNIGRRFSEPEIRNFIRQTALGLRYIHSFGIIHRDIKPANILYVRRSKKLVYKISDFGISKMIEGTDRMSIIGTPIYTAPEILENLSANFNSDVWSLGRTVVYMITQDLEDDDYYDYRISYDLTDLLDEMLDDHSYDRIEADEILDHDFLTNY